MPVVPIEVMFYMDLKRKLEETHIIHTLTDGRRKPSSLELLIRQLKIHCFEDKCAGMNQLFRKNNSKMDSQCKIEISNYRMRKGWSIRKYIIYHPSPQYGVTDLIK